jgi:hypothetical protein
MTKDEIDLTIKEAATKCGISYFRACKMYWPGEYTVGKRRRIDRKTFEYRRSTGQQVAVLKEANT